MAYPARPTPSNHWTITVKITRPDGYTMSTQRMVSAAWARSNQLRTIREAVGLEAVTCVQEIIDNLKHTPKTRSLLSEYLKDHAQ